MKILLTILFSIISLAIFSQVKIPVVKYYNPALKGALGHCPLIDEQATNVQNGGSSEQSVKPANSINNWWDSPTIFDANTALIVQQNGFNRRLSTYALPTFDGDTLIPYEFKFDGTYQLTKICIYVQLKNGGSNRFKFKSGTPFNYTKTLANITTEPNNGEWYDIDVNDTTQWVEFKISEGYGIVNEIVFYGNKLSGSTEPTYSRQVANHRTDSLIGTNVYYGLGWGSGNVYYDEGFGLLRYYAAAVYLQFANGELKHPSGTGGGGEPDYIIRQKNSGSNVLYCLSSMVDSGMVTSTNNPNVTANQKPIPTSLGNESTGQRFNYSTQLVTVGVGSSGDILTFNDIAHLPSSYARAAWSIRKYAKAVKQYMGLMQIETDNERDGSFKGAGYMYPYQLAAMVSAEYDGHMGTLTYNGDSVGVYGTGVTMVFPALSYINSEYLEAMKLWWDWNRTTVGGWKQYPFDVFNVHSYPSTLEVQNSGSGESTCPENLVYNLNKKLDTAQYYSTIFGAGLYNTEIGFDVFDDAKNNCSFINIHSFGAKSKKVTQADWTLRSYLMHIAKGISMCQYWLADQYELDNEFVCQTFERAGFLEFDTVINFRAVYQKRPSWYWLKTLQNRLGNYTFKSQTVANDSLYKQLYVNGTDSAYVIWYGTQKDENKISAIGNYTSYNVITPTDGSETGISVTGTGALNLVVEETPKIIYFSGSGSEPPATPCNILRTRKKFVNAP